jgi:putative ABC transport system ATP-binding protein
MQAPQQTGMALSPESITAAITCRAVTRRFKRSTEMLALDSIDVVIARGESVAVTGPSGSGKTTLLHILAGLDRPTSGTVEVLGERLDQLSESRLAAFRASKVGLVFQESHLIPRLTALENVVLARLPGRAASSLVAEAADCLAAVGLGHKQDVAASDLSGGERQRVGIARALVGHPSLVVADEPTGNLDHAATLQVISLLAALRTRHEFTCLVATHNPTVAESMDRVIELNAGQIVSGHGTI